MNSFEITATVGEIVAHHPALARVFEQAGKEEQILFPMIRQLEASKTAPAFHCGSLGNPIGQMELEHDQAGSALQNLRELTDGYVPKVG